MPSARRRPIEKAWLEYAKEVLPDNVSEGQVMDMKASFYSGANGLYNALMAEVDDEIDEPTKANMDMLMDVRRDIGKFAGELLGN